MVTKVDEACEILRSLPLERQEELADIILSVSEEHSHYSAARIALIDASRAQAKAGEFVSEDDLEAMTVRFRG